MPFASIPGRCKTCDMNLILLEETDFISESRVRLSDRRLKHLSGVHRVEIGKSLRVGVVDGMMGQGVVRRLETDYVELEIILNQPPPPPLELTLLLALPRPKFLARCLQTAVSMGVKEIFLLNSYRVEKAYWSSAQIAPESLREYCLLGLEQGRDTRMPEIHLKKLFKPFVEDELPALAAKADAFVAHPAATTPCPYNHVGPVILAIGPEGGFIDYEIEKFTGIGFTPVSTFERILKVETALASLIGRLK